MKPETFGDQINNCDVGFDKFCKGEIKNYT